MAPPSPPSYSLQVREQGERAFYDVYFRWPAGRLVKRRVGRAWVNSQGEPRRGQPHDGYFDVARAHDRAREIVAEHVASTEPQNAGPTFRDVAHEYLRWLEDVRGAKPSTLRDHRSTLSEPDVAVRGGRAKTNGHVMRALGDRPAAEVTPREVEDLLASVEKTGAGPRTVNKYREIVLAVYTYACRPATLALTSNPAQATDKRRLPQRDTLATYSVAEVEQLADALAAGAHRDPARPASSDAEKAEDRQDAELVRVAAYTGLRQGELRALRWSDVGDDVLTISRALSAGVESGTKGGKARHVPLVPQAAGSLERLRERRDFTAPEELVFCNWLGRPLDESALRRRFMAARDAAGLRPLRFHDLRHTYGSLLASGGVPVTDIQSAMGHADVQTTARYLHARQASEQVDRFARAFSEGAD
jgi:integrase